MSSNYTFLNINARNSRPQDNLRFPNFQQPYDVGEYSISSQGHFENSNSQMKFLILPAPSDLPFSLSPIEKNIQDMQEFQPKLRYMDNMFFFLRSSTNNLITRNGRGLLQVDANIVCTREVLKLIMCAPYEYKVNWTIAISKYRNTIYMCPVKNLNLEAESSTFNPEKLTTLLRAFWMNRLRQRCHVYMGKSPIVGDNNLQHLNNQQTELNGQYYCAFKINISGIPVLFDAPVLVEQNLNALNDSPKTLVDLQLRLDKMNSVEWSAHCRNEALKWWVECFLVGIEKLYIAYHDNQGIVSTIKETKIAELHKECQGHWSPNICGNFLARFLNKILILLKEVDSASTVYLMKYNASNGSFSYEITADRSEHSFIPDWFRIMMEEQMEHLNKDML